MSGKQTQVETGVVSNSVIPLPIPADPQKWICVQMMIPDSVGHRAAFLGAISNLATWRVWQRDTGHNAVIVAALWLIARLSIKFVTCNPPVVSLGVDQGVEQMFRQNPDNPCELQSSVDGITWCTWADLSKCTNFGTAPGAGKTPQPSAGGGSSKSCYTLDANSILSVGVPVSTGDTIMLTASGSGWDGGEFDFGPLWRCPDGKQYIANSCTGFETTSGTDPVPSAFHMSTIISINGTFYSIMPGSTFTVPGGVSNVTPFLQVNDSDITNNQGSYDVCITVTNNQAATWSHTIDFTLSSGGYVAEIISGSAQAVWQAGVGWVANPSYNIGVVDIEFAALHNATITNSDLQILYDGSGTCGLFTHNRETTVGCFDAAFPNNASPQHFVCNTSTPISSGQHFGSRINENSGSTVHLIFQKITVHGTGVNPFI